MRSAETGQFLPGAHTPLVDRFWSKVQQSDGCWLWQGTKEVWGYGVLSIGHLGRIKAHRFSYELANGPIPEGLHVCHKCDVRACVRPDHLFVGTDADNLADMRTKGRGSKPPRKNKLSRVIADEIRDRYTTGIETQADLAMAYGVSQSTIGHIMTNRIWSDTPRVR